MANPIVHALAKTFIERSEALSYKGKKRDDAALDFFCGAAVALAAAGKAEESQHIHTLNALIVAVRGYTAVRAFAAGIE